MTKRKSKTPLPLSERRYGIVSPYGNIWTVKTFDTEDRAKSYLEKFWHGIKSDITKFKVVPVDVTISVRT